MAVLMESMASPVYSWSTSGNAIAGVCSCPGGRVASLMSKEKKNYGHESPESLQALDLRCYPERSETYATDKPRSASGETLRVKSEGNKSLEDEDPILVNPLPRHSIHERLRCCTNGFFTSLGPFSEFESNCGCTSHNLVDWSTRLTWTNLTLRHQWKVREVTFQSPYRTSGFQRVVPSTHQTESDRGLKRATHFALQTMSAMQTLRPQAAEKLGSQASVKQEMYTLPLYVNDERPFVCEESGCGRTFCRNEELTRHSRIHSGNRPFQCQKCGRRFVRRDHLTKHLRTHLPVQAKRSYTCPMPSCTHRYTRSDALTRHIWTAHHTRARQPSRARARVSPAPSSPAFTSTAVLPPRFPSSQASSVPKTPRLLLPSPLGKEP